MKQRATSSGDGDSQDITEYLEEFNYGFKLGLGVHIGSFVIDARYDMGLANLFIEDTDLGQVEDYQVTSSGVVVTLGVTF